MTAVHKPTFQSIRLPSIYNIADNAVIVAQAVFLLLAPFIRLAGGPEVQDRAMDVTFILYLGLVFIRALVDRPTVRLLGALILIGAYCAIGFFQSYMNDNVGGFFFEVKMFVSAILFFCLLDKPPKISDFAVRLLFYSFLVACAIFLVLNPGERIHLVNESNYLCMYIGIAMFSWLTTKGKSVTVGKIAWLAVFTLFIFIASESRTGLVFLTACWLVYIFDRFNFRTLVISSAVLFIFAVAGAMAAIAVDAPIVKRFEDLKNPSKVDRFQYLEEAKKIVNMRSAGDNTWRLGFSEPVSTRVDANMKWLTSKSSHGTEQGQLYPHHFHLAYLRILMGHGVIPLLLFVTAIALLWRYNKYLALGLGVCSLSMSTPYLSLFFGALHIAMAFPTAGHTRRISLPKIR